MRKIYKFTVKIKNSLGNNVRYHFKPSNWKKRKENYTYDTKERVWIKKEVEEDKYLINLGFDFKEGSKTKETTKIHGYIQFTSKYPAIKFYKGELQRLCFDLLKKQRKRASNFNLSDEKIDFKNPDIKAHIVLMQMGQSFYDKDITDFKEENYYYNN